MTPDRPGGREAIGELELHGGGELVPADDAALWARLAELDAAAEAFEPRSENTLRSYASDWRVWERYVAEVSIPLEAGTPGAFLGFVIWLGKQGKAPSTIERNLYGAAVSLRERGVAVHPNGPKKAKKAVDALARMLAEEGEQRGRGQAPPLTVMQLRAMSEALPDTLKGRRDRAILTVGFGMAARRSELANLLARDVVVTEEGLKVFARYGKTGARSPAIRKGENEWTCPRRAWLAWAAAADLDPDGPAFLRFNRHKMLGPISAQGIGIAVADAAEAVGLEGITGHSMRAGLATAARKAGHDYKTIAEQGGWSPNGTALHEYLRIVDQWADNATAGIGM
ncbi:tyrosine-type recombinase/integrase [Nonomuraea cavernae]|uniref:tyrosine-type recombinase/integrase n=1 Tax=Nonomuraea cavernae TaxID=2045107 RepID=UPI00166B10CF|nr:tyrosine-type recombinase/integrase [Nonomuraea cavernae]MCA2184663.1 tyrosine-type recombinase/integrase [Nonomuraea cavernae]